MTKVNEYGGGDVDAGIGTYVPIMGDASGRQRVTWRVGDTSQDGQTVVNDLKRVLVVNAASNGRTGAADLHFVNGFAGNPIGHTAATASTLAVNGDGTVNFDLSTGIIVPNSESDPLAIGAGNYTQDWFSFTLASTATISLTANNSTQFLTAGVADGVGTLRSTLGIYDSLGTLLFTGMEDASTVFSTFSGSLGAGDYFASVGSFGGHEQVSPMFNDAQYYDTGAYFLTGSGFAVPEPATFIFVAFGAVALGLRRRRRPVC